ncbi:MAG: hypothetical protein ACP5EQ_07335, partial [Candidatus Cloacimonadia bacterium]
IVIPEIQAARFVRPIQINMKNNNGKELYVWKKEAREAGFNSALVKCPMLAATNPWLASSSINIVLWFIPAQ